MLSRSRTLKFVVPGLAAVALSSLLAIKLWSIAKPAPLVKVESVTVGGAERSRLADGVRSASERPTNSELEILALEARLRALEGAAVATPEEPEEQPQAPPASAAEQRAALADALVEQDVEFQGLAGATPGALEKQRAIDARVTDLGIVQKVECKPSTCCFEVSHEGAEDAEKFAASIELAPGFVGATLSRFPSSGANSYVFFVQPNVG